MSAPATDTSGDTAQPRITAQYPSACAYTFGQNGFADGSNRSSGLTPISDPEAECVSLITTANPDPDAPNPINSFPLDASPSITFSEPVDPTTLDGNILMTDGSGTPIDIRLRAEGSSVVVDPVATLDDDTEYTLTVGNGITDLAGNGLQGSYPDLVFSTEPMVRGDDDLVAQTAPYISVIIPGLPCALKDGNFMSGGDTAGRCFGDTPEERSVVPPAPIASGAMEIILPGSPERTYSVPQHPSNVAIQAQFSKPVQANTIVAADGCLINGDGSSPNTIADATFAVQIMDGEGRCTGIESGKIVLPAPNSSTTRRLSYRPVKRFQPGKRYWIVVCGSPDSANGIGQSQCSSGATIIGQDGYALNTNPIASTGTTSNSDNGCYFGNTCVMLGDASQFGGDPNNRGVGGPDLVIPFDATAATKDFYTIATAMPFTDTNGNGFADRMPIQGEERSRVITDMDGDQLFDDSLGQERDQLANSVDLQDGISGIFTASPLLQSSLSYLSGGLATVIRKSTQDCSPVMSVRQDNLTPDDESDDLPIVSNGVPDTCIPVDILSGGLTSLTATTAVTFQSTGRVVLRYPYLLNDSVDSSQQPQRGYIIPECQGTFRTLATPNDPDNSAVVEEPYDYKPCFVANLTVTANGPDLTLDPDRILGNPPSYVRGFVQQDLNVQVFGSVAFERNGSLVISTKNTNTFDAVGIIAVASTALPGQKRTYPGKQRLQLVTPPVHGGPLQAFEVP